MQKRAVPFLRRSTACRAAAIVVAMLPLPAMAVTEIRIWHSLTGVPAETFSAIVERFDAEQKNYHVALEFKGDEKATAAAGIAAVSHKGASTAAPDLLQVSDEASGELLAVKGAVRPVYEVLPLARSSDFQFFLPGTVAFMKDAKGRLEAFPLQASVPVLLYNKTAYKKAGIDANAPPSTWRELQKQLLVLQDAGRGMKCDYTTSEQAWIHIENIGALHGETIATKNNGLDGSGAKLTFNDLLHVRHIALLMSWVKSELFTYSGHQREGDARFASGECGTLTTASGSLGDILKVAKFEVGVAPLPFYDEAARQPVNTLVGGSALWVMGGKSRDVYNGIAAFLAYLATPVVAAEWHQKTGSLPWTSAAYIASERTGFYDTIPGFGAVMKSAATSSGPVTRGIRLPNYEKVRDVMDDQLEAVWSGRKPPKQGLDDAVALGDAALRGGQSATPAASKGKARSTKQSAARK